MAEQKPPERQVTVHFYLDQAHEHDGAAMSAKAAETDARCYPCPDEFDDDRPITLLLTRGQVRYLHLIARVDACAACGGDSPCRADYTLDLEHTLAGQLADAVAREISTSDLDEPPFGPA